jgi:hypothetical protein
MANAKTASAQHGDNPISAHTGGLTASATTSASPVPKVGEPHNPTRIQHSETLVKPERPWLLDFKAT